MYSPWQPPIWHDSAVERSDRRYPRCRRHSWLCCPLTYLNVIFRYDVLLLFFACAVIDFRVAIAVVAQKPISHKFTGVRSAICTPVSSRHLPNLSKCHRLAEQHAILRKQCLRLNGFSVDPCTWLSTIAVAIAASFTDGFKPVALLDAAHLTRKWSACNLIVLSSPSSL